MARSIYAPPLEKLHAVLDRATDLDTADERDRHAKECVEAVGRALEPMTIPRYRPPEEEIAAMVLALTYGEMIALVACITAVADGKLDGIDLAPILYAWGHKTRTA